MVYRLSNYAKNRIISLKNLGYNFSEIRKKLMIESIPVSYKTIRIFMKKWQMTGSVKDLKRSGRKANGNRAVLEDFIEKAMRDNDELTSTKLRLKIEDELGYVIPKSTLCKIRNKLGWVIKTTRYCQLIREVNRVKRLEWCQKMLTELNDPNPFHDVIFTDETKIQMDAHGTICFTKVGEPAKRKAKPKYPWSVLAWGGISKSGRTRLIVFNGIMDSEFYCEVILEEGLQPFIKSKYSHHHR